MFISKKILYECPVNSGHACMMNSKAIWQKILQLQVLCNRKRTGEGVSLAVGTLQRPSRSLPLRPCPLPIPHNQTRSTLACVKQQHHDAAEDCLDNLGLNQLPGRKQGNWACLSHLALLSFRPKDFCGGGALSQKQAQSVLL